MKFGKIQYIDSKLQDAFLQATLCAKKEHKGNWLYDIDNISVNFFVYLFV